jgi:hypothetical protein
MVLQEAGRDQGAEGIAGAVDQECLWPERAATQPLHLAVAGVQAGNQQSRVAAEALHLAAQRLAAGRRQSRPRRRSSRGWGEGEPLPQGKAEQQGQAAGEQERDHAESGLLERGPGIRRRHRRR